MVNFIMIFYGNIMPLIIMVTFILVALFLLWLNTQRVEMMIFQFAQPPNSVRNSGTSPASCQAPSRLPYIAPTTPAADLETGFFPWKNNENYEKSWVLYIYNLWKICFYTLPASAMCDCCGSWPAKIMFGAILPLWSFQVKFIRAPRIAMKIAFSLEGKSLSWRLWQAHMLLLILCHTISPFSPLISPMISDYNIL